MGIKQKLIGTFFGIAVIPLVIIGLFSTTQSTRVIEQEVGFYSEKIVTLMGRNVDLMIGEINKEFIRLMGNREVTRSMQSHGQGDLSYEVYQMIQREIEQIMIENTYIRAAMVITPKGQIRVGNMQDAAKIDWAHLEKEGLLETLQSKDSAHWENGYLGEKDLMVFRNIKNPTTGRSVGIALFKVPALSIQTQIETLQLDEAHSNIYLIDKEKRIMVNKDETLVNQPIEALYPDLFDTTEGFSFDQPDQAHHGKRYYVVYTPCNDSNWQVVMRSNVDVIMKDIYSVKWMMLMLSLGIAILAISIGYYISQGVAKPIQALMEKMQEAEKGNLVVEGKLKGSKEMHRLGMSFEQMMLNIKNLITQTAKVVEHVKSSAKTVQHMATTSRESSSQVSAAIQEIAVGATEQANEVEASIIQMQKLSATINDVVDKIKGVVKETEKTTTISYTANDTIQALTKQTATSVAMTKNIEKDIYTLQQNTKHIMDVIHLIEGISEQTNLLSLNAAIEAARAGQYGRGFGVVADEVRKLATQSKDATLQIRDIIGGIERQTQQTVEGVQQACGVFDEQQGIVEKANTAFNQIIQAMGLIAKQMRMMEKAIGEMSTSKEETIASMGCIQTIVQQVVALTEELLSTSTEQIAAAEQVDESSEDLVRNVDELQKRIEEFNV